MHAIVLAGGYATRLWPITKDRPKMFLPVGDQTVIDTIFQELESEDRIDDVYVSTNERFADEFHDFLADRPYEKPTLSVEDTSGEAEKFGVVGALAQLVEREDLEKDTLVIAGDNLISFAVSDFLDFFEAKAGPTLAAYDVGSRERAKSYGLVTLEGDRVVDFQEKPADPDSTLVSIACYAFPRESLSLLNEYLAGENNPDEPGWFIEWLQERDPTYAYTFDGVWFDIGTADSYLEAVEWALDSDSHVSPDATVEDCEIGTGVQIMPGAEVRHTELERAVVFPEATIRQSTLEAVIVDKHATVTGASLAGSLVGSYSAIQGGE